MRENQLKQKENGCYDPKKPYSSTRIYTRIFHSGKFQNFLEMGYRITQV
jgi:hypothetical protein